MKGDRSKGRPEDTPLTNTRPRRATKKNVLYNNDNFITESLAATRHSVVQSMSRGNKKSDEEKPRGRQNTDHHENIEESDEEEIQDNAPRLDSLFETKPTTKPTVAERAPVAIAMDTTSESNASKAPIGKKEEKKPRHQHCRCLSEEEKTEKIRAVSRILDNVVGSMKATLDKWEDKVKVLSVAKNAGMEAVCEVCGHDEGKKANETMSDLKVQLSLRDQAHGEAIEKLKIDHNKIVSEKDKEIAELKKQLDNASKEKLDLKTEINAEWARRCYELIEGMKMSANSLKPLTETALGSAGIDQPTRNETDSMNKKKMSGIETEKEGEEDESASGSKKRKWDDQIPETLKKTKNTDD